MEESAERVEWAVVELVELVVVVAMEVVAWVEQVKAEVPVLAALAVSGRS